MNHHFTHSIFPLLFVLLNNSLIVATPRSSTASIPLFAAYPALQATAPHIPLGDFPTPVQKLEQLAAQLQTPMLYIKRDDLSGQIQADGHRLYGGNKVRKLEFLLADALEKGAQTALTFGGAGSNHALATSVYANLVGLNAIALLDDEHNAHAVRRTLLLHGHYNTELYACEPEEQAEDFTILKKVVPNLEEKSTYIIPMGGSNAIGTLGFVNAAYELKNQIAQGLIPEPDYLYVTFGSRSTAVGLILGLRAAGLKTKVVPICVTSGKRYNDDSALTLLEETNALLHSLDPSFPLFNFKKEDIGIRYDFRGEEYGLFTEEGQAAIALMRDLEGITLDGVYTGKAFAALLDDIQKNRVARDSVILFWNTYCDNHLEHLLADIKYQSLPTAFHRYFETDVQPRDR